MTRQQASTTSRWLYFLVGNITGGLICWVATKLVEILVVTRKVQREINQDLATGKFSDFQKHVDNLQKVFPTAGGLSGEKINKMIESLVVDEQKKNSPTKDMKKREV